MKQKNESTHTAWRYEKSNRLSWFGYQFLINTKNLPAYKISIKYPNSIDKESYSFDQLSRILNTPFYVLSAIGLNNLDIQNNVELVIFDERLATILSLFGGDVLLYQKNKATAAENS